MKNFTLFISLLVSLSTIPSKLFCQITSDFIPRHNVVFEDDFREDKFGVFPSKWHQSECNQCCQSSFVKYRKYWKVEKQDTCHVLGIYTSLMRIQPNIANDHYLNDSFTVEYDFYLDSIGESILNFYTLENLDPCYMIRLSFDQYGDLHKYNFVNKENTQLFTDEKLLGSYPGKFITKKWHHFALSYYKNSIDIYVDKYHVAYWPDCGFIPYALSIGAFSAIKYGPFKITTGKEEIPFDAMLKHNELITHAISFDVNAANITQQGITFIKKLAYWLKENDIMLEIDGHTDNDGSPEHNRKLSQERAEAVRKQLIAFGIESNRLTTKGLGATKPLVPNNTLDGKAENRRVEFIKK